MAQALQTEIEEFRKADYPVDAMFLNRWSPRALSGEEIEPAQLMQLFEAARWAPSSYNNQPWRFIYARRNSPSWDTFFSLLRGPNQLWAGKAAALVVVVSKKTFDNGKPSMTHTFDSGAAWMNIALQASLAGWVAHGMEGFDYEKAQHDLRIPSDFQVEAMIAIGRRGPEQNLPPEAQAKEFPSGRKPVMALACEGLFHF